MRDTTLGTGAYGQVCKATLDELPCAAKLLHPILVDPNNPRNRTRFEQECRFLSEIRHPNIVQYLGVAQDGETGLPVLLMELMDDSLTHFLEQSEEPLAYHVQVNISHDIALAVAFLHLNRIVHRDLSSNNVLLIGAGSRAKVTDFGMSKLTELNPRMTGLTKCPGTPAYMSPEALLDPPVYTEKLDCFQTGVLMIQTITRKFPDPGPAMNRERDARFPTGWHITAVPEVERRQSHLSLIPRTHPMLGVAMDCLKDTDSERPSAQQICRYLSALKEAPQYGQSLEGRGGERDGEVHEREELIQQLRQGNHEREREVRERERDIERLQSQLQQKEGEVREREREVREVKEMAREREREVREREGDIERLQSQLQQKEGEVREREREVREVREMAREREREVREVRGEIRSLQNEVQEKESEKVEEIQRLQRVIREKDQTIHQLQQIQQSAPSYTDSERPSAQQICRYLSALKEAPQYGQSFEGRGGERDGEVEEREGLIQQLRQENQEREREVREKEGDIERLQSQLQQKEGEIREREREVREREGDIGCLQVQLQQKVEEIREGALKVEEIQHLQRIIQEKDQTIHQLQQVQQSAPSYTCLVSGPGLQSATANHPTHVRVEVRDSSGRPLSWQQNVTAELVLQSTSQATPTSGGQWPLSKKALPRSDQPPAIDATVAMISPSRYEVSYTAVRRGQHKLHVRVNGSEINGSPFTITVYPDPTQLGSPVRVVTGLNEPYGIAINSRGEMVVTEYGGHQVSVLDIRGQRVRTFGSDGDRPEQMICPAGIAVDDVDNIYVSSWHKLQKFTSSGELIKCVGQRGSKEGEFDDPRGVTIHSNQVYVCDPFNQHIQVFDLDLNFIQSISLNSKGRRKLDFPYDVAFDTAGNMYVAEYGNERVQVMDSSGQFIRAFGQGGEGKLSKPTALYIADKHVYVSDYSQHRIAVYQTSGHFVTSFGRRGHGEGELYFPYCITSCANGFIHVCDCKKNEVQTF